MIQFYPDRNAVHQLGLTRRDLDGLSRNLKQTRKLFGLIRDKVIKPAIDDRFFYKGDMRYWKPVTQQALNARKKNMRGDEYPLVDTGTMWDMAISNARFGVKGDRMEYGFWPASRFYAPAHDLGLYTGGAKKMPKRPWAYLSAQNIEQIEGITEEWVSGVILDNWDKKGLFFAKTRFRPMSKFIGPAYIVGRPGYAY